MRIISLFQNSRQFNILVHLNVEHFKTNLKCVWCEFTTLNEYSLNDHCKKEHGQVWPLTQFYYLIKILLAKPSLFHYFSSKWHETIIWDLIELEAEKEFEIERLIQNLPKGRTQSGVK